MFLSSHKFDNTKVHSLPCVRHVKQQYSSICKSHTYLWFLACIKICICSGLIRKLNTTVTISITNETTPILNECTSKHLSLNNSHIKIIVMWEAGVG